MKKIFSVMLIMLMFVLVSTVMASANNHTDVDFSVAATSTLIKHANSSSPSRMKQDASSSYVNYINLTNGTNSSGPYKFEAIICGCPTANGTYVDWTTKTSTGANRTKAIVTKGTEGFVRQDIYEMYGYGSYAQIYGKKVTGYASGTAKGCWSCDSVGSYSYYNYTI